jgi:predicted cobalt transporter CbtA
MTAAGYPLVVLAGGYGINRPPVYFNPTLSLIDASVRQLWATATIRASSVGSSICNAVGTLGKHFLWPTAMVHNPRLIPLPLRLKML